MSQRPGFFARFFGLIHGLATGWMRQREEQSPDAVYEHAIAERVRQYRELKQAVAGILFMRNKLEAELTDRRTDLARTHEDVRRAVRRSDDGAALALIATRQRLEGDVARIEREVGDLRREADEAKSNLVRFREEIRSLEREKGRTLASLANARARRRMREAIEGLSVDADMRALESVREHVAKMVTEGELDRELGEGDDLAVRLREIRREADADAARRELAELKRELAERSLPAAAGRPAAVLAS